MEPQQVHVWQAGRECRGGGGREGEATTDIRALKPSAPPERVARAAGTPGAGRGADSSGGGGAPGGRGPGAGREEPRGSRSVPHPPAQPRLETLTAAGPRCSPAHRDGPAAAAAAEEDARTAARRQVREARGGSGGAQR